MPPHAVISWNSVFTIAHVVDSWATVRCSVLCARWLQCVWRCMYVWASKGCSILCVRFLVLSVFRWQLWHTASAIFCLNTFLSQETCHTASSLHGDAGQSLFWVICLLGFMLAILKKHNCQQIWLRNLFGWAFSDPSVWDRKSESLGYFQSVDLCGWLHAVSGWDSTGVFFDLSWVSPSCCISWIVSNWERCSILEM